MMVLHLPGLQNWGRIQAPPPLLVRHGSQLFDDGLASGDELLPHLASICFTATSGPAADMPRNTIPKAPLAVASHREQREWNRSPVSKSAKSCSFRAETRKLKKF